MKTTDVQEYDSGLSVEKHNTLCNTFNPFMVDVQALVLAAGQIEVVDANDEQGMEKARDTRLCLKRVRVSLEKQRVELKESSLLEGKAIDGMANVIKALIVPAEKSLQEKEDFVKVEEAKRIKGLVEQRTAQLIAVGADPANFLLDKITDQAFEVILKGAAAAVKIQKEEAAAEAVKAEADKKEQARLKKENDELRAKEEKRKADDAERVRLEKVVEQKKKDAAQAALDAPDKEKLAAFLEDVSALKVPQVEGDIAQAAIEGVRAYLNGCVKALRGGIAELSTDKS